MHYPEAVMDENGSVQWTEPEEESKSANEAQESRGRDQTRRRDEPTPEAGTEDGSAETVREPIHFRPKGVRHQEIDKKGRKYWVDEWGHKEVKHTTRPKEVDTNVWWKMWSTSE